MIVLWNSSDMVVKMMLVTDDGSRQEYAWRADRSLAKDMLKYLSERLAEHGVTLSSITGIGVYRGPGSFTGLRIGLTVLNTLAAAQHIPIVGATGDEWMEVAEKRLSSGKNDEIVMPEYGSSAHVTAPRK